MTKKIVPQFVPEFVTELPMQKKYKKVSKNFQFTQVSFSGTEFCQLNWGPAGL